MTDKQIDQSIEKNELKLTPWGKFQHYNSVGFIFIIPIGILFVYSKLLLNGTLNGLNEELLLSIIVPTILGILSYRIQRKRLKFKIAETNLTRENLDKIIDQVAKELKWSIFNVNERIVEAKTFPSLFSGSRGEQITIIFHNKRVLVNSICDLDKQSSVLSFGRNETNTDKLIYEIEKANKIDLVINTAG